MNSSDLTGFFFFFNNQFNDGCKKNKISNQSETYFRCFEFLEKKTEMEKLNKNECDYRSIDSSAPRKNKIKKKEKYSRCISRYRFYFLHNVCRVQYIFRLYLVHW